MYRAPECGKGPSWDPSIDGVLEGRLSARSTIVVIRGSRSDATLGGVGLQASVSPSSVTWSRVPCVPAPRATGEFGVEARVDAEDS